MEKIKRQVVNDLINYPRKTIRLSQLEELMKPCVSSYEEFANVIISLEADRVLEEIKTTGRTTRLPSLAWQYRIYRNVLINTHHTALQFARKQFHPSINLDFYYSKDPSAWEKDLPYLQLIHTYLEKYSFPKTYVPAPERSLELVGNEKWISEHGGKELLERVGLFSTLKIIPLSEPLMFAVNPATIHHPIQSHLIVENKTTYQALLPILTETDFSTLIFGSGKSVIKSIEQFTMQYPVDANHHFFYFGDIDREGILIWYLLSAKQQMLLAMPFYQACLAKEPLTGKEYQKEHPEALTEFLEYFPPDKQSVIRNLLLEGRYYPQERLKTEELQDVWRAFRWKNWI